MAVIKLVIIILCVFSYEYVSCDLNLTEGSPCTTKGLNGTCVNIFKCNSAALTYLYVNAGYDMERFEIPELPDICSQKDGEPVVCCTDCDTGDEQYRNSEIGAYGEIISKEETLLSSLANDKCREYFRNLPYPCRFPERLTIRKIWKEDEKCHETRHFVTHLAPAIGGRDAFRWEFPHVALLGYGDDVESAQWLCGGSVISDRYILTAAHCTSTNTLGNVSFSALGILKRTDPKEYWKIYKIKRIILHPEYKSPSKYHDIALLETENKIAFGSDLLPACLNVGSQWSGYAQASGWGRLGPQKSTLADNLQVVHLEEFNETECAVLYKPHRLLANGYDHEKQMCYGSFSKVVDTCEGDSGGPLQIKENDCLYTIIGVTSYGKECGVISSAGMYTRVSYYVPWIESVVWPEETEARRKKDNEWLDKWLRT